MVRPGTRMSKRLMYSEKFLLEVFFTRKGYIVEKTLVLPCKMIKAG